MMTDENSDLVKKIPFAEQIKDYYSKIEKAEKYSMFNEKRVKAIDEIYRKYKKYFGNKILDLCCGAGILGFIIEKDGKEYVGVDINENMIKLAKEYTKKINSKCRFYLEDVRNFKLNEKFDTFVCLGNSLRHLTIFDWIEVMKNVNSMAKENSYFIIEYRI